MAEDQCNIWKFNQTSFRKFGQHCAKRHEDQICENLNQCTEEKCLKRHPKICKHYSKNGKCWYKEGCAYLHKDSVGTQGNLNLQVSLLLLKHNEDIRVLTKEVNVLKNFINLFAVELAKTWHPEVSIIEHNK